MLTTKFIHLERVWNNILDKRMLCLQDFGRNNKRNNSIKIKSPVQIIKQENITESFHFASFDI